MNIAITGSNGFLGFNVCKRLLEHNHNVLAISRHFDRFKKINDNKLTVAQLTTSGYRELVNKLTEFEPNVVIHFAWAGGNSYKDANSMNQYVDNINPSISLLELTKSLSSLTRFIGVGSFTEYGDLTTKAFETQLEKPNTHYGLAKYLFKNVSELFCLDNNIHWTWIRPCYAYGEGDVSTRLLPTVISKLRRGTRVDLDSCESVLDYLHVTDFSNAVLSLIEQNKDGVYNICSGKEYVLREIIEHIASKMSSQSKVSFNKSKERQSFSTYICGDNSKLISSTGWEPVVDITAGLDNLIHENN